MPRLSRFTRRSPTPAWVGRESEHYGLAHRFNTVDQYKATVADEPEYLGLPFLVVLFSDFMPDSPLLDQWVLGDELPEISGVLRLVHNREFYAAAARMATPELKRRILIGDLKGLPPEAFEWRLVRNPGARYPVPTHLALCCLS